jgi:hypothetical protein
MNIFAKLLLITCSFSYLLPAQKAQNAEGQEVRIYQETHSRLWRCYHPEKDVYDEQKFNDLVQNQECSQLKELKIDFTKQSLIGFRVHGDCFVHGTAKVFRQEETKTYQVRVRKIWGGCRAAGAYTGWLVIDKIPADHKVEFSETRVDGLRNGFEVNDLETEKQSEVLSSRQIDLKGCVQMYPTYQLVIKDETNYLNSIRHDASHEKCLKDVEKVDFEKNSLLGLEINSGYCRRPAGLEFQVLKDETAKQYLFNIGYTDPKGSVCRALSQYELWVLVPKIPDGFEVKFNVQAK